MNSIISSGAIISLYISLLVITKKRREVSDYFLGLFFLINSAVFFISFLSYEYEERDLLFFLINIDLLTTPIFYLYIYTVVKGKFKLKIVLNFIPYFLTLFILLIYGSLLSPDEFDLMVYSSVLKQPFLMKFVTFSELLVIPIYIILSLKLLKGHSNKISEVYSYREGVDLKWLRLLLIILFISWIFAYLPYYVLGDRDLKIAVTLNGFLVMYLGFFGVRQVALIKEKKKKYSKSGINNSQLEINKKRVLEYMETEKPYLSCELNIYKLSEGVGVSSHHLSQVFSLGFKKSFYDFINSYRVEEFKKRIKEGDHRSYTLLSIAMDSGFNSKSSFNRVFKQVTGETPSLFVKNNNQ